MAFLSRIRALKKRTQVQDGILPNEAENAALPMNAWVERALSEGERNGAMMSQQLRRCYSSEKLSNVLTGILPVDAESAALSAYLTGAPCLLVGCSYESIVLFNTLSTLGLKADFLFVLRRQKRSREDRHLAGQKDFEEVYKNAHLVPEMKSLLSGSLVVGQQDDGSGFSTGCNIFEVAEEDLTFVYSKAPVIAASKSTLDLQIPISVQNLASNKKKRTHISKSDSDSKNSNNTTKYVLTGLNIRNKYAHLKWAHDILVHWWISSDSAPRATPPNRTIVQIPTHHCKTVSNLTSTLSLHKIEPRALNPKLLIILDSSELQSLTKRTIPHPPSQEEPSLPFSNQIQPNSSNSGTSSSSQDDSSEIVTSPEPMPRLVRLDWEAGLKKLFDFPYKGHYRPMYLFNYRSTLFVGFLMFLNVVLAVYLGGRDVRFFHAAMSPSYFVCGLGVAYWLGHSCNVAELMEFSDKEARYLFWNCGLIFSISSVVFGLVPVGTWRSSSNGGYSVSAYGGLFCLVPGAVLLFSYPVYYMNEKHGPLAWRQILWALLTGFGVLSLWIVNVALIFISRVVDQSFGSDACALYVSVAFSCCETGVVILLEQLYTSKVYLPMRTYEMLQEHRIHGFASEKKRARVKNKCIFGDQKRGIRIMIAYVHAWSETGRQLALLTKAVFSPANDISYAASTVITFFLNLCMRLSLTRMFFSLMLPHKWEYMFAPTLFSKLHDNIKFSCGWLRYFAILGVCVGRGALWKNWSTFSNDAFYSLSNDGNIQDRHLLKPEQYNVWCWNKNVFYLLLLAILLGIAEDIIVLRFMRRAGRMSLRVFARSVRASQVRSLGEGIGYGLLRDPYHSWSIYTFLPSKEDEDVASKSTSSFSDALSSRITSNPLEDKMNPAPLTRYCWSEEMDVSKLGALGLSTTAFCLIAMVALLGTRGFIGFGAPVTDPWECLLDIFFWYTPNKENVSE